MSKKLSKSVRKWVKKKLHSAYTEFESQKVKEPVTDQVILYLPYEKGNQTYVIGSAKPVQEQCEYGLPIPPKNLWLGYGKNSQEYLHGKVQVDKMLKIVEAGGYDYKSFRSVLDFGCGAGRMIRWLKPFADKSEIWGVDISADHITWAINNLCPPFHFATTTTVPHLPYSDNYFDFIYAGSVFTHIDDLVEAWLLELRRINSPNGCIYITIQDKNSLSVLKSSKYYKEIWLKEFVEQNPLFVETGNNFEKIVGLRSIDSQVFYDIDYFKKIVSGIFEIISINPEVYGFQTAVLMKPRK